MSERSTTTGTPLVLVVNDEEWSTRSIESILKPKGYAVLMAYTGRQGLQLASKIRPDLILIDLQLPDLTGVDLCARMRKLPTVRPSTPILISTSGPVNSGDRLEAFRAGAWDVLHPPLYPKELLARFDTYVAAKQDADDKSYVDPLTGFYNTRGLMRRVAEIGADTARSKRPLACVALGLASSGADAPVSEARMDGEEAAGEDWTRSLASLILSVTRLSDAVGRADDGDFVIVAPGTDEEGAARLAERVMEAVDEGARSRAELRELRLKAGFYALSGDERASVVPEEFVRRATRALRDAQAGDGEPVTPRVLPFQQN